MFWHRSNVLEQEKIGLHQHAGTAQKTSFEVLPIARRESGSESISE
jgi:hypothetical protein